jgi:hypothetical protein
MKLLYKPFGIVVGIIAGILARQVFSQIWGHLDDREPPKPTTEESSWGKVRGAAAGRRFDRRPALHAAQDVAALGEDR